MSKLASGSWIVLLLTVSLSAEGAPPPEFFACESQVNAYCQSFGQPAQLIPICSQYLQVCPTYPEGPVVNGSVSYIYNCLYSNAAYSPQPYNYYAGIVGSCGYTEMQTQYKLIKTVTDPATGTQVPMADMVTMAPSVVACGSLRASTVSRVINLQCVDANTGNSVSGCSVSYNLTSGGNNGGHAHSAGRPLGNLSPGSGSVAVPSAGLAINYDGPEVSGDVTLNFTATDPNGASLSVNPTSFHVVNPNAFVPIQVADLNVVTVSHPGEGGFGTSALLSSVSEMVDNYNLSFVGPKHSLESQAVSLPLGGLFDIKQNWAQPHCGHRNGNEIDLSLISNQLTADEQKALARATLEAGLHFYVVAESPQTPTCIPPQAPNSEGCANHWHATLP